MRPSSESWAPPAASRSESIREGERVVVYNPIGGGSDALGDLAAALEERGVRARWLPTTEEDPGTGLTRRAVEQGAALVIVAGGDGTIRACAEGALGSQVPLALIPMGTGNVLARDLGIPDDVPAAVDVALDGQVRAIDVGLANGEPFVGISGIGLAARMIRDASPRLKARLGPAAYLTTAMRHLWRPRFDVHLELGDGERRTCKATLVLVATAGEAPGGLSPFPEADPGDGVLRVLVVEARGLVESVRALSAVALREPHDLVRRYTSKQVEVKMKRPQPFEMNGEPRPRVREVEYAIKPRALRVRVPRGAVGTA